MPSEATAEFKRVFDSRKVYSGDDRSTLERTVCTSCDHYAGYFLQCHIQMRASDYPDEWSVADNGEPRCAAFVKKDAST